MTSNTYPNTTWGECVYVGNDTDIGRDTYDCWDRDYYYGGLTLLFIYLPSSYTVAAVLGPKVTGWCSMGWGFVPMIVGSILWIEGLRGCDACVIIGVSMAGLGIGTVVLGGVLVAEQWKNITSSQTSYGSKIVVKSMLYPILFIFSPLIFLYIKFLTIIKRDNKMIECQKKVASMGEAMLEASPQYCLQMYVVLHTLDPTWSQWVSIFTSLISLNIPNIEKYHEPHGLLDIIKKCGKSMKACKNYLLPTLVIILNTVGKIMSISIISVFFEFILLFIIGGYFFTLILTLFITLFLYDLFEEEDKVQQLGEALILGFLTQTNLSDTRAAKIARMILFYFTLILYCGIVMTIMIICNVNPDNNVVIDGLPAGDVIWKDLALVQNITKLNTVCGVTLTCFLSSWILDILCQCVADRGGVYHSAWREVTKPQWKDFFFCCTDEVTSN